MHVNEPQLHRCAIIALLVVTIYLLLDGRHSTNSVDQSISSSEPVPILEQLPPTTDPNSENTNQFLFLKPLKSRLELGDYFNELGFRVGAELGVAAGGNAYRLLDGCHSCEKLYLIDLWKPQINYNDTVNTASQQEQEQTMEHAKMLLKRFGDRTEFIRGRTDTVVKQFPPSSLDFIYLDARHDYCAVSNDLELWWPVLRPGGIFAGHDYMDDKEVYPVQDWTLCENGSSKPGAVKRAVDEFAMKHELFVSVMYREKFSNSYMMRKPLA